MRSFKYKHMWEEFKFYLSLLYIYEFDYHPV